MSEPRFVGDPYAGSKNNKRWQAIWNRRDKNQWGVSYSSIGFETTLWDRDGYDIVVIDQHTGLVESTGGDWFHLLGRYHLQKAKDAGH